MDLEQLEQRIVDLAQVLAVEMLRKSGVREWESESTHLTIADTARAMAERIVLGGYLVATSKILVQAMDDTPPQICFANFAGDFSPTAANDLRVGTDTQVEMALTGLANGSYYQSTKFDFGENRAEEYKARIAVEIAATPTAGNTIELWFAPSDSATAGTGNSGGASGATGSYAGYSSNAAASVKQLDYIGAGIVTAQATATVQIIEVGRFSPSSRYGSLVLLNGSGAAFHSDDVEIHIVLNPQTPEAQ